MLVAVVNQAIIALQNAQLYRNLREEKARLIEVQEEAQKKLARDPSRFGRGAIEGVAGPEASNNAAAAGAMVPMFSLGVPGSGTTAVMLGALIMFGLRPGPEMFELALALAASEPRAALFT